MKRGTPQHPKTVALCRRLKLPLYDAIGILELLWHFTAQYAPQGDIGKYDDKWIEASIGWNAVGMRKSGSLIQALIDTHWIDIHPSFRLIVHDWHDHCDSIVKKRLERMGLPFITNQTVRDILTEIRQTNVPLEEKKVSLPIPLPIPEPHTQKQLRAPIASDQTATPSQRFEEFWVKYPRKQHRDQAARAWCSVVTVSIEAQVFACEDRYLSSDEVSRGIILNPEKWLFEQSQDGWTGTWPTKNGTSKHDEYPEFSDDWKRDR